MGKQRKKINLLDVFRTGKEDQAEKLMRRRGGGGAVDGKNFDKFENIEFKTDEIDAEDDEEITEDDAFDDEDDEKYGLFFAKGAVKNIAKKSDEDEDQGLSGDEGDYVDLSEMLEPVVAEKAKSDAVLFLIPELEESEGDSEEMEYLSDEDSETEQGNFDDILDDAKLHPSKKTKVSNGLPESVFMSKSSSAVSIVGTRKKIAFGDLMESAVDDTSFGNVKKQLSLLESTNSKAVSVPLAPRMQEKLDRAAAKEQTEKSISQWVPIVKKNREADTLSFPMNLPPAVNLSSGALIGKFEVIKF
jgi:U3 small nucleolar RNA-associated protein 14